MAKPLTHLDWTVGNPDFGDTTQEPTSGKKEAGWLADERPPIQIMNWLFFNIDEWIKYFEEVTDVFATQGVAYDAFIGVGGTHADINEWQDDPDILTMKSALVISNLPIDDPQEIDVPGCSLAFKAGVSISKNGPSGSDVGIIINTAADRTRIKAGRLVGFNSPGLGIGIKVLSKNNVITENLISDCDTDFEDTIGKSLIVNNHTELA